jgi:NADH:ubiquinone oxidoreductase subunit 2 (subunit N)
MEAIAMINILLAIVALRLFRQCQNKWRNVLYIVTVLLMLTGSVITLIRP